MIVNRENKAVGKKERRTKSTEMYIKKRKILMIVIRIKKVRKRRKGKKISVRETATMKEKKKGKKNKRKETKIGKELETNKQRTTKHKNKTK